MVAHIVTDHEVTYDSPERTMQWDAEYVYPDPRRFGRSLHDAMQLALSDIDDGAFVMSPEHNRLMRQIAWLKDASPSDPDAMRLYESICLGSFAYGDPLPDEVRSAIRRYIDFVRVVPFRIAVTEVKLAHAETVEALEDEVNMLLVAAGRAPSCSNITVTVSATPTGYLGMVRLDY